ncbi:WD repeat-containing protein 88-like [Rhopilema esculentum]|uniref:WD repeat-containing protein 88-like n=1 Tax=Rhopilema esculentum TaxID=499914 RepID=UPI0031D2E36B
MKEEKQPTLGEVNAANPVEFSRDVLDDNKATWEHEDLAKVQVLVFHGHDKGVNSCCFMDNDEILISASDDHTVKIWNRKKQENVGTLSGHDGKVTSCRASFDARRIASTGWDNHVIVWDTITGKPLWTGIHDGIVTTCDFSFDGKYVVTGNDLENALRVWDAYNGKLIKTMNCHQNTVTCCRFSKMTYRFCSTSMDQTTRVIDLQNYRDDISPHQVLRLGGHENIISCAGFSGDDRRLCTGSWDKTLKMWDVNAGSYRKEGPVPLTEGHEGSISSCKFSDDGTVLVSASYDQTVTIWDADLAYKKFSLQGHTGWVTDCDLSKNMALVASCSKDGTLRIWNIERSEDIPIVLQNKLSIGLQMLKCQKCGKMFSISKAQDPDSFKFCVFCRLKEPVRPFSSEEFIGDVSPLPLVHDSLK